MLKSSDKARHEELKANKLRRHDRAKQINEVAREKTQSTQEEDQRDAEEKRAKSKEAWNKMQIGKSQDTAGDRKWAREVSEAREASQARNEERDKRQERREKQERPVLL